MSGICEIVFNTLIFSNTSPNNLRFPSKPSIFPTNSFSPLKISTQQTRVCSSQFGTTRSIFRTRCTEQGLIVQSIQENTDELTEIASLKKALIDSVYGTDRGVGVTGETRAEVLELITKLEGKNPTPVPTEALSLLNGKWILAYTSFSRLFPLLSCGTFPLVKVEEVSQTIDSESFTVQNSVQFSGPLATTSVSANAKFEVRSPLIVRIKFEEGIIGTPQLTDWIVLPENVEFLGQKIDLTPFKGVINSIQHTASSVAKTISNQPPLRFPIATSCTESWLLTTYLDEELRISRGDEGSAFVLLKEGSPLLTT